MLAERREREREERERERGMWPVEKGGDTNEINKTRGKGEELKKERSSDVASEAKKRETEMSDELVVAKAYLEENTTLRRHGKEEGQREI